MRILHIVDHHWRYNGMVHACVDLACAQSRQGHTVALCASEGSFADLLAEHGVEMIRIDALSGKWRIPAAVAGLWNATGRFRPDVVHAHMTRSALIAWPVSRLRGIPLVTCVQNSFSRYAGLMKVGDRVITGCRAVAEDMAKRGVPKEKLRPVLNGTIGSARQPPGEARALDFFKHPAVVTVCGLHWRKGVPDLIRGFQMARAWRPQMHLYIFGEGPDTEQYRALVDADNARFIHFRNPVPNARPYLMAADAFVLASVADPAPLVIAEAREAGLAIIATRVDGIPELLEDGRAGILVEPHAPQQIAEKLVWLFSDPEHLKTWRANSQIGIARLSVARVAEQTVDVYREAIHARRAHRRVRAIVPGAIVETPPKQAGNTKSAVGGQ